MLVIIFIAVLTGAIVGWLASQVMPNDGFGLQGDVIVGVVGGVVGGFMLLQAGFIVGGGYLGPAINSVIGAVVAIFGSRFLKTAPPAR